PAITAGSSPTASWSTRAVWEASRPWARSVAAVSSSDSSARSSGAALAKITPSTCGGMSPVRVTTWWSTRICQIWARSSGSRSLSSAAGASRVTIKAERCSDHSRTGWSETGAVAERGGIAATRHEVAGQKLRDRGGQLGVKVAVRGRRCQQGDDHGGELLGPLQLGVGRARGDGGDGGDRLGAAVVLVRLPQRRLQVDTGDGLGTGL